MLSSADFKHSLAFWAASLRPFFCAFCSSCGFLIQPPLIYSPLHWFNFRVLFEVHLVLCPPDVASEKVAVDFSRAWQPQMSRRHVKMALTMQFTIAGCHCKKESAKELVVCSIFQWCTPVTAEQSKIVAFIVELLIKELTLFILPQKVHRPTADLSSTHTQWSISNFLLKYHFCTSYIHYQ